MGLRIMVNIDNTVIYTSILHDDSEEDRVTNKKLVALSFIENNTKII